MNCSASSTSGLSRRSSVPVLNDRPIKPMRRLPVCHDLVASPCSMCDSVRRQDAGEHRQLDVVRLGQVHGRAQVLGQARAAEREARLQVGRRDVELRVLADQVHHLEGVDAERLAQPRRLVGERDLQRVEVVAAVLHHLGRAHRGHDELARQVPEQRAQRADRHARDWRRRW